MNYITKHWTAWEPTHGEREERRMLHYLPLG